MKPSLFLGLFLGAIGSGLGFFDPTFRHPLFFMFVWGLFLLLAWANARSLEQARLREQLLSRLSASLIDTVELHTRFAQAAETIVSGLADWCTIFLVSEDGHVERVALAHRDPAHKEFADRLRGSSPSTAMSQVVLKCIKERTPTLIERLDIDDLRRASPHDNEILQMTEAIGLRSYMILPLVARGRSFGAVMLISSRGNYTKFDMNFAQSLVDRIAISADNAYLYENAQRAARAREHTMAIVSHDLRNPLSAISISAELLAELVGNDARLQSLIGAIQSSTKRALNLMSDLLTSAKIESGGFVVDATAESATSLVDEALDMLAPLAMKKGIKLEKDLMAGIASVAADRPRILQVLSNVVGNAIKFSPNNGTITVEVRDGPADNVLFAVRDNGQGIPVDALPHIFDRYWQPPRTKQQGIGLGLSIAKGIIDAHGGRIWVESKEGIGSTFYFTLPHAHHEVQALQVTG